MKDKQRYRANEEPLAEQTIRVLESRASDSGSKDDQATAELGRLLRDAAKTNLPESNIDLREQLIAKLDGGSSAGEQVTVASSVKASSTLASESTGHRRFWIAAAASGLLLVGGAIAYNSDFVGQLSNVAVLEQPNEPGNNSVDLLRLETADLEATLSNKSISRAVPLSQLNRSNQPASYSSNPPSAASVPRQTPEVVFQYETKTRMVPVTRMATETKTRQVPINRIREEKKRVKQADGSFKEETVKIPYTEMVPQPYTVNVPFTEQVAQSYAVPVPYTNDGKRIEKSDYSKFGLDAKGKTVKGEMYFAEGEQGGNIARRGGGNLDGSDLPSVVHPPEPAGVMSSLANTAGEAAPKAPVNERIRPKAITGDLGGEWNNGVVKVMKSNGLYETQGQATVGGGPSAGQPPSGEIPSQGELFGDRDLRIPSVEGETSELSRVRGTIRDLEEDRKKLITQWDIADRQVLEQSSTMQTRLGGDRNRDETNALLNKMSDKFHLQIKEIESKIAALRSAGQREEVESLAIAGTPEISEELRRNIEEMMLLRDQLVAVRDLGPGHAHLVPTLKLALEERLEKYSRKYEERVRAERLRAEANSGEQYQPIFENAFIAAKGPAAISTFSIDVDTASYANMRRMLNSGQRPPADSIRLEELVNYFQYDYKQSTGEHPFSVNLDLAACPWQDGHQLFRVALKGKDIHVAERPPTNVVFLIDVSGSMSSNDKLPLLKSGFQMMSRQLGENDRVSIVTYAGNAGVALEPTNGTQTSTINTAIEQLSSGGSTHGSDGIKLAYELAQQNFIQGGVNRVMLATDGDLNVGVTSDDALVTLIKEKAAEGVFLTVLGFGSGNLKDAKLEKLADNGNGMYAYIDSTREAHRVLVDQLSGSLVTIAKDVKIQVEFNPVEVKSYRLLGYENRMLETKDFDDDRKDAGEIGAGHTVTAIYQIEPAQAVARPVSLPAGMKYQVQADVNQATVASTYKYGLNKAAMSGELATVALRYKQPEASESQRLEVAIQNEAKRFEEASADFRFASSVAGFGMYLRNSKHRGSIDKGLLQRIASESIGKDESGYRSEFIDLIRKAPNR